MTRISLNHHHHHNVSTQCGDCEDCGEVPAHSCLPGSKCQWSTVLSRWRIFSEKNIIHDIKLKIITKLSSDLPPLKMVLAISQKRCWAQIMTWNFCRLLFMKYFFLTFCLGSVSFCSEWRSTTRCLSSQPPNVRRNNDVLQTQLQLRSPFWLFLPSNSFPPQNPQKGRNNDQADSVHADR